MAIDKEEYSEPNKDQTTGTTHDDGTPRNTNPAPNKEADDDDDDDDDLTKEIESEVEENGNLPEGDYESPSETNFNEPNNPNDDPIPGFGI